VVENKGQLDKFLAIRAELPLLKAIVIYDGSAVPAGANDDTKDGKIATVYSWREFMDLGRKPEKADEWKLDEELKKRGTNVRAGHASTLIYTSGTTGTPKAVMLSHDNVIWTCRAFILTLPKGVIGHTNNRIISYLPLSHIAAQMLDMHAPVVLTGYYNTWTTTWFARPDAMKGTLLKTLEVTKPTIFFGVPRVWEKFSETMKEKGASVKGIKKTLSTWAKATGRSSYVQNQLGAKPNIGPSSWNTWSANTLVFSKIRAALGLDQALALYTSAAPISRETLEYFGSIGMPVLELFGMSELTGPQTNSMLNYYRIGATGTTLPGTEILIDHVADRDKKGEGEVCFRGRHVMMGYMKNPEKSAESIDPDGWLHSGDTGRVDDKGFLYITGRIKELIIGSGGENIAPVPIEDDLKKFLPGISSCMMVGDRRKFNVVLVTLKTKLDSEGLPLQELVGESLKVSPDSKTLEDAKKDEKWKAYITAGIQKTNKNVVSNAACIQYFAIVEDFSVPGGELTPTMKLKRNVVAAKHADVIEALYQQVETKTDTKDQKDKPKDKPEKSKAPEKEKESEKPKEKTEKAAETAPEKEKEKE
jgi:long-chain-fatty-acid--CoA ligase ACSBG